MKVFRNVNLKGIISKDKALQLLGLELNVICTVKGIEIEISRDDMNDVCIDYADEELCGGEFDELK